MDKNKAKQRIDELNKLTAYYAQKYYDDDNPEISDFEYDMLMLELKNLEKEFPEFIAKDSLTQKVGGTVKEGFKKVAHSVPLQSLQDVFSFDELYGFDERMKKFANNIKYVIRGSSQNVFNEYPLFARIVTAIIKKILIIFSLHFYILMQLIIHLFLFLLHILYCLHSFSFFHQSYITHQKKTHLVSFEAEQYV